MPTIPEQKAGLRGLARRRSASLSAKMMASSNAAIFRHLTRELQQYQQAQTLFCYVSQANEVATLKLISHALAAGKCVSLPLICGEGLMRAHVIKSLEELEIGRFGILAPPASSQTLDSSQIELALVPGLAFDRQRKRLGRGGGYYDRFLRDRSFFAVGLCREALLVEDVPTETWDQALDAVLTETALY